VTKMYPPYSSTASGRVHCWLTGKGTPTLDPQVPPMRLALGAWTADMDQRR